VLVIEVLLHTADWLASQEGESEPLRADDALVGALALAAADLEHQMSLVAPRPALAADLAGALSTLPPQWAHLPNQAPFAQWLALATLAEHWGALRLAIVMLNDLERLLRAERSTTAMRIADAGTREQLALCWTRRGRIARTQGQLDDAALWYQQAAKLTSRRPWLDAHPQALLGMAALAANRGNIPEVERRLRLLTQDAAILPALYRIAAHQFMAVTKRKRRQYIDALLHAWSAYDLLDGSDFRREQLLGTIADIALEAGDADAAARGFHVVLSSAVRPLVRVPALYGALRARLEQLGGHGSLAHALGLIAGDHALATLAQQLHTLRGVTLAPTELVLAHLAEAELSMAVGNVGDAERALDAADQLASAVGLHERQFLVDAARTRLRTAYAPLRAPVLEVVPTSPVLTAKFPRHPALNRLLQLQ
jgi:tetratricopeptide (TPR) repeat protein